MSCAVDLRRRKIKINMRDFILISVSYFRRFSSTSNDSELSSVSSQSEYFNNDVFFSGGGSKTNDVFFPGHSKGQVKQEADNVFNADFWNIAQVYYRSQLA